MAAGPAARAPVFVKFGHPSTRRPGLAEAVVMMALANIEGAALGAGIVLAAVLVLLVP